MWGLAHSSGLPLHMQTVITLEPIKSCPVTLPWTKEFLRGLARSSLATRPITTSACSGIVVTRKFQTLTLPSPICFVTWSRVVYKGRVFHTNIVVRLQNSLLFSELCCFIKIFFFIVSCDEGVEQQRILRSDYEIGVENSNTMIRKTRDHLQ